MPDNTECYPQNGTICGPAANSIAEVEDRIRNRVAYIRAHEPFHVELPTTLVGPAGHETFGWIDFGHLPNTRDLGGLVGVDGRRVRDHVLLRSGALGLGSDADLNRLRDEYHLSAIVDLRNDEELIETPDPIDAFPQVNYVHADVLARTAEGITQEKATRERVNRERAEFEKKMRDDTVDSMEVMYRYLLLSESGLLGYQKLFQAILACDAGSALWHCSVGRDRCGLASMLVETALGVSQEDIETDYLATNIFATNEQSFSYPAVIRALRAACAGATEEYGSVLAYIEQALGVGKDGILELRNRYLEPLA